MTNEDKAPTIQQLNDPTISTPNTAVFDYSAGQTVQVTQITGGNANLESDNRHVWRVGGTWRPIDGQDLSIQSTWTYSRTDDYLAAFQRHLLANQWLAQLTVPGMREAGWGRIVNVVSTSVKEPIANLGVSNTIRGAVASWAKTLSRELGADGITVNNVLPGYTRTGRLEQILRDRVQATGKDEAAVSAAMLASVPAGRFAEAHEVAAAIAFLATPAAGYVNGVSLAVDGGRMQSI